MCTVTLYSIFSDEGQMNEFFKIISVSIGSIIGDKTQLPLYQKLRLFSTLFLLS
jgi:hypothetical protein